MRIIRNTFTTIIAAIIVAALAIFAAQNLGPVTIRYLGTSFSANLWWIVLAAAALGFILALVLIGPGFIATAARTRLQSPRMQQEMTTLRQQRDQLRADRDQLQTERDNLRIERNDLRAQLGRTPAQSAPVGAQSYASSAAPVAGAQQGGTVAPDTNANRSSANAAPNDNDQYAGGQYDGSQYDGSQYADNQYADSQSRSGRGFRNFRISPRHRDEQQNEQDVWSGDRPPAPTA